MSTDRPVRFPTTAWSLVREAKDADDPDHMEALNRLLTGYWKPVFCFVRAWGYPTDRAEDLTQEFFHELVKRRWIRPADPDRGKFRTFLLTMLKRFLSKYVPKQRQFDDRLAMVSVLIRDEDRCYEPPDESTPERIFMKQWALAVLRNALERFETECREKNLAGWYRIFTATHFPTAGQKRLTQEQLAAELGVSRDQVRDRLRKADALFRSLLRAELNDQVDSAAEIDTEIDELFRLIAE